MKLSILVCLATLLFGTSALAIDYVAGVKAGDVPPRLLRNLLRQGKAEHNGAKIVYSKDTKVPSGLAKKWNAKKLSGGSVPTVGEAGDNTIFIKEF